MRQRLRTLNRRKTLMRSIAFIVGGITVAWVIFTPDDVNGALIVLWSVIAAHGLLNALITLRRVRNERIAAHLQPDPRLALIADSNVRRQLMLSVKLAAFLTIALMVLTGTTNVTISRTLIVGILLLMSAGAWMDADEIDLFDEMTDRMRREAASGHC